MKNSPNHVIVVYPQVVYLRLFSKFYTKLCKLNNDSRSVVSLLRESLFSFRFRGHPIAFSVLSEWPEVFPKDAEQSEFPSEPREYRRLFRMTFSNYIFLLQGV